MSEGWCYLVDGTIMDVCGDTKVKQWLSQKIPFIQMERGRARNTLAYPSLVPLQISATSPQKSYKTLTGYHNRLQQRREQKEITVSTNNHESNVKWSIIMKFLIHLISSDE